MNRQVTRPLILGLLMCCMSVSSGTAQLPNLDEIMQRKLEHSRDLLAPVLLGNHVEVERYAYELTLLSEASTWTRLRTPQYLQFAARFRESSNRLMEEARNRDSEAVGLAYAELITTCVECHLHVRGAQQAD